MELFSFDESFIGECGGPTNFESFVITPKGVRRATREEFYEAATETYDIDRGKKVVKKAKKK